MTKLDSVIQSAELFRDSAVLDCSVIVCDAEGRILHYVPARTFVAPAKLGEIAAGPAIQQCIATKKAVRSIIPARIYGIKLRSIINPVLDDDGQLIGLVATATTLQAQETLFNAAHAIAATAEEMTATTEQLAASASQLAETLSRMQWGSEQVLVEISKTDEILKFVNEIAANSSLLGLNAAIEAARAGEQGRGFAVVAEEIRKMAHNSAQAIKDIKKILAND